MQPWISLRFGNIRIQLKIDFSAEQPLIRVDPVVAVLSFSALEIVMPRIEPAACRIRIHLKIAFSKELVLIRVNSVVAPFFFSFEHVMAPWICPGLSNIGIHLKISLAVK